MTDQLYKNLYSSRIVAVTGWTYNTEMAKAVVAMYGDSWADIWGALSAEYNPIHNYEMTETESPDITRTRTPNITRENITTTQADVQTTGTTSTSKDVYGFNSGATGVPQDSATGSTSTTVTMSPSSNKVTDTDSETGTETETTTGTRSLTRSGNIGVTTSQQMIESELELRRQHMASIAFDDLNMLVTLSIQI